MSETKTCDCKPRSSSSGCGCGGMIAAAAISWATNHSVPWAIAHGMFGWFYLIYYAFGGGH